MLQVVHFLFVETAQNLYKEQQFFACGNKTDSLPKYLVNGDTAIYDAYTRTAQPFSDVTLINGQITLVLQLSQAERRLQQLSNACIVLTFYCKENYYNSESHSNQCVICEISSHFNQFCQRNSSWYGYSYLNLQSWQGNRYLLRILLIQKLQFKSILLPQWMSKYKLQRMIQRNDQGQEKHYSSWKKQIQKKKKSL
ncbi:unnamed protein product [Paramecium sonneborni]|uniref:Uncharacterized protein n=1 Tax=Paramecium sonneborni TaxID=65129 RepID=A0A8S1RR99_9CILI|nr:unnamed protein product [Paramecium sonneborni]